MNAVTIIPQPQVPAFTIGDMERIANAIAKGGLFGSKDPNAVLTLCMLAQAEGQHPAVVFRDYYLISGKPSKKAEAMQRDFLAAGGKIEWHELTDDCADATFSHPMGGSARISWDKARVKQAQLGGNAMHTKYPRQMLRSRVISEGVRTVFPGATSGMYVPEEMQDFEPIRNTPPTPQAMRARDLPAIDDGRATLPPDAATDAEPIEAASDKAADWLGAYIADLGDCLTQQDVIALNERHGRALGKLAKDRPELSQIATNSSSARYEALAETPEY